MEEIIVEPSILTRVKSFVSRHRVGIAVASTAAICIAINRSAVKEWNEFLEEKDLTDEYYTPDPTPAE